MATDPRTIIDSSQDPGLSPTPNNSASSNVADYDTRERKTVIIDYTDPPLYGVPELQIFNDPGGSNGQVQFNKGNRFGGDNNLVWNSKVRTLSILGNLRVSGEITGRIVTNTTKLKITGGEAGDTLITDGTGNLSWVPAGEAVYGNANVANYLPTYTGNLNGSNLTISNTAYIYNISSTGSASLTTANVSGNLTTNAIYTNNYFYANGEPFSGGGGNANLGNFSFNANTMTVSDDGTIRALRNAGYQPNITIELDSAELSPILYSFTSQGLVFPDETIQNTAYPGYQAPVTVSDNAPNLAIEGDVWFDSEAGRSYVKYNDQWVDMNPTTLSPDPANPFDQDLNTTDNVTFNKVSTTNINANSNIFVSANNSDWQFGDDGVLTFPSGMLVGNVNGTQGIQGSANAVIGVLALGSNGAGTLQWVDDSEDATQVAAVVVNSPFVNPGAVQIVTGPFNPESPNIEHSWTFDANGNLVFPDNTVQTTAYTGQQNSKILVSDIAPNANIEGRLWFNSVDGRTYVTYNNQWVDSSPTVMDPTALRTNQDNNIEVPKSAIFTDGRIYQDYSNGISSVRWVNMTGDTGMLRAFADPINENGEENQRGALGLAYQDTNVSGLYISSFNQDTEKTWTFEGTGNLRFPDDTIQTTAYQPATLLDGGGANANYAGNIPPGGIPNPFDQELNTTDNVQFSNINASYFIGNGSMLTGIPSGNANTGDITFITNTIIGDGNLNLQPNNSVSSAYLDIYLTTGPDIHIASNSENLILGRDSGPNVLVGVNGNVSIRANSGTGYTWTFDSTGNLTLPNNTFAVNYANGTQVSIGGGSYGDSNVVTLLGSFGSNSISTTGNARVGQLSATATDSYDSIQFSSNGIADNGGIKVDSGSNMVVKAVSNFYVKRAGSDRLAITDTTSQVMASTNVEIQSNKAGTTNTWTFDSTGNLTLPGNNATIGAVGEFRIWATNTDITVYRNGQDGYGVKSGKVEVFANNSKITETTSSGFQVLIGNLTTNNANLGNLATANYFSGNGSLLTAIAVRTTGTWTVTTGTNTYSITVPINGNYQIWVRCNIPNGIIVYQATVSVTNTNVPVLGTQRAWNYTGGGSPILLTTMPTQIVGAEGTISTTVVATTTANVFDFVINNSSGSSQTVSWGYITL